MNLPLRHEAPLAPRPYTAAGTLDSRVRLRTTVPLLVHVESVLGWQRGPIGYQRALTLRGQLHLPELRAEIGFHGPAADAEGASPERDRASATILPRRSTLPIPLQHLSPAAREQSDVWALTPAPGQDPPWKEHYAGQLADGPITFDQYVPADATVDVTVTPEDGENGEDANVHVSGELRFERPVHMRLLFRDPRQGSGSHPGSGSDEAVLIPPGSRIPIAPQSFSGHSIRGASMAVHVIQANGGER